MFRRDYASAIQTLLLIISNIHCGPVGRISELMFSSINYSDFYLTPRFKREEDTNSIPIVQTSHLIHPSESRVIAAAVCVSHCLRECVESLRRKSLTDISIEDVLTKLQAFPTQLQSECIWLSPGFLFYEECEQACASDQPYNECLRMCESGESPSGWTCHNGCRSLSAALKERSGDCPPEIWPTVHRIPGLSKPAQSIGWFSGNEDIPNNIALDGRDMLDRHFTTRCSEDVECVRDREKCCQSRCREAIYRDDILPPAPTVQVLEARNPSSFILSWGQRDIGNNLSEPVVYVLQVKSYFGPDYDSQRAGAWRTLVMTTLMDAQLKEPLVGWWYQFQLTAVNRFGSRGFEFLSPPVQLTNQKPKQPSPPVNLTCNYMALQMNGTIAAEIQWAPPTQTSIPVTEYIVNLCLNATGACSDVTNVPKMCGKCNKMLSSSESSIFLENLLPDSLYRVQVTASSAWGSRHLQSLPATLYFRTQQSSYLRHKDKPASKQAIRYHSPPWEEMGGMDDMLPTRKEYPPSYTAQVSEIRYVRYQMIHNRPLLYKISWDPGYLDNEMSGEPGQNSLHFSRNTSKEKLAIQVDSVRKYRVVWGPSQDQAINSTLWNKSPGLRPRINPIFTETKVLRNGETSILLKSLKPGRQYVVIVQTIASTPASNSIDTQDSKEISLTSSKDGLPSSMQNIADKQTMRIGREFYLYFETPKSNSAAETLRLVQRSMNRFHGASPICQPDQAFVLALFAVPLCFSW